MEPHLIQCYVERNPTENNIMELNLSELNSLWVPFNVILNRILLGSMLLNGTSSVNSMLY
jgi:hypothetical protein